jgi:hypothetical protein
MLELNCKQAATTGCVNVNSTLERRQFFRSGLHKPSRDVAGRERMLRPLTWHKRIDTVAST